MSNEGADSFMMIGLHKLAAQNGDGLVPELYDLLSNRAQQAQSHSNVTAFPLWEVRSAGEEPDVPLGQDAADGRNVIAFEPPAGKTAGRGKKA
jgi:hypothetical protein